jgi:predicted ABC-type ATPase/predicted transcriptional regulator of viral defense system
VKYTDDSHIVPATERVILATLARASKTGLISVTDAAKALDTSESAAAIRLARLTRRGWLRRARRGLYLVVPLEAEPGQHATAEDPWVLAQQLFAPCYIGGWSAVEHWGFTEQLFRSTLVVTAASVRATNVENLGHMFRLFRVPRSRLTAGVVMEWRGKERVAVSGPERMLIDCLRNPELCGGARHLARVMQAYGESPKCDFAKLAAIAKHAASGAAWKRLGYFGESFWPNETTLLHSASRHLTAGNARLDPAIRRNGGLSTKWRLFVNVKLDGAAPPAVRSGSRQRKSAMAGPRIIIIAGPNGAGKSTFARNYLPHEAGCPTFVNADLLAAGLSPFAPDAAALRAGRIMLEEIRRHVQDRATFAFETTLSGKAYARMIPGWQSAGYRVDLVFLRLPEPQMAIDRVASRVAFGGHDVAKHVIRRRFAQGWANFQHVYRPLVDSWHLYDNSGADPSLIEEGSKS